MSDIRKETASIRRTEPPEEPEKDTRVEISEVAALFEKFATRIDDKIDLTNKNLRKEISDRLDGQDDALRATKHAITDVASKFVEMRRDVDALKRAREESLRAPPSRKDSGEIKGIAGEIAKNTKSLPDLDNEAAIANAVVAIGEVKAVVDVLQANDVVKTKALDVLAANDRKLFDETRLQTILLNQLVAVTRTPVFRWVVQTIVVAAVAWIASRSGVTLPTMPALPH